MVLKRIAYCVGTSLALFAIASCGNKDSGAVDQSSAVSHSSAPAIEIYGTLNDTGITDCANAEQTELACPQQGFPQQDGETGRDAQGGLTKQGGGEKGFDWTKLDATGSPLVVQDQSWSEAGEESAGTRWSCVQDNVTGLMWEVKESDADHPRFGGHSYTWYSMDHTDNGGNPGVERLDNEQCPTSPCNTENYVRWANQQGLCGKSDWRMPSVSELMSIAVYSNVMPALDEHYFPNAPQPRFFTNQTSASDPTLAWYVYFTDASVSFTNKSDRSYIRLVRGGAK